MKKLLPIVALALCSTIGHAQVHTTSWKIKTSAALDAMCLLNTLTGDSYYRQFYPNDYHEWTSRLKSENNKAIKSIYKMKTKRGVTMSAFITFMLGYNPDTTVSQLYDRFNSNFSSIKQQLKQSDNFNMLHWLYFRSYKKELTEYLYLLRSVNFDSIYYKETEPNIRYYIDSLKNRIESFNVIPQIESFFGGKIGSDTITLFLLRYNQPYGISIGNNRYITYYKYDISLYVKNAIHEVLHKPVNRFLADQPYYKLLKKDPFIYSAFANHDKNFGYNRFNAAIEEACVRFLDQVISERIGVAIDARQRWKEQDKGMHVFAAILYQVYLETKDQNLNFKDILAKASEQCAKVGGKAIYEKLYADGATNS